MYTRIAICETLEKVNLYTSNKMVEYLGKIGNNQYKKLLESVSLKKSYPLPRDIVARSLGKMSTSVFPILMDVLETDIDEKILEVIDAIGFMVFYNHELADLNNATRIYEVMKKYKENQIIVWKCIICLSAFPLEESKLILTNI